MKLASLVISSLASPLTLVSAQSAPSNASAPLIVAPSNSSYEGTARFCSTDGGVTRWFYNSWSNGPYSCYGAETEAWTMRYAYRSGGTENVHWKYTDDPQDPACLSGWEWYEEDGVNIVTVVRARTTREESTGRLWCALPVYRSGGSVGRKWQWCVC